MQRDRKKIHRKIVKYIQLRNKQLLADDYVGSGRFRIDLCTEDWHRYSDCSGGRMTLLFKMSDTLTGNKAFFVCSNYDYEWKIFEYANDFLIRCSSGSDGHFPPLHYVAYDVHKIIDYDGRGGRIITEAKEGIIDKYNWLGFDVFKER